MSNSDSDSALIELLAPDGYYTYLGVTKPLGSADGKEPSAIDEDVIKKNYRKLSLKHHPDKGGDADTFHVLNRAQRVLMNPKLRKQYDILGIDLDDDDVHNHENSTAAEDDDGKETSSSQGIVQEIAGTVLAGVIQLGVRTRTFKCAYGRGFDSL
jgi:curved DNA-binding protein CbpA